MSNTTNEDYKNTLLDQLKDLLKDFINDPDLVHPHQRIARPEARVLLDALYRTQDNKAASTLTPSPTPVVKLTVSGSLVTMTSQHGMLTLEFSPSAQTET